MQQLHLVGFTTESDHLILSAKKGAKSGSFVVPLDERLLEVIADAVRRRNAEAGGEELTTPPELQPPPESPKRTSLLSPREIQARLRAGRTLGQVAREAVTDEEWVAKFAPPVLAERERIVSRVRDLVFTKPRRGESAEPLGLSVRWNLADRGVRLIDDEFDACWSAFHIGDTLWGITFEFVSRARKQRAEWEVDLADDVLLARNRVASDLGFVEPGRRRRLTLTPDPPEESKGRRAPGGQTTSDTATEQPDEGRGRPTKRRATPSKRTAKAARPTATSKKTGKATKAASRTTKKATTGPAKRATKARAATTKARPAKTAKSAKATRAARTAKATKTTRATKAAKATKTAKARKAGRAAGSSKRASRPRGSGDVARVVASPNATPQPPSQSIAAAEQARRPPVKKLSELERRKLEMVRGTAPTPARRPAPRPVAPRPAPEPVRQVAEPPAAPQIQPPPTPGPASVPDEVAAHAVAEEAARLRREERRRARAERVAQSQQEAPRLLPSAQLPEESAIPSHDGQVVTIRANRAGGAGDVVVPGGPRPLRPAKAAAQPKRRRLTRSR